MKLTPRCINEISENLEGTIFIMDFKEEFLL